MTNPAAWHPDPTSAHEYRWWDGERWTEHVADGGQASVDPLPGSGDPDATSTGAAESEADAEGTGSSSYGASAGSTGSATQETAAGTGSWQQPGSTDPGATAEQPEQDYRQDPQQTWQQPERSEQSWQQPGDHRAGDGGGQPPAWQQAPAWSQPGGEAPAATGTNGIAIAAMVIGIIAILISWIPVLGALAGILALVLGFVGRGRFKKSPAVGGNGPAITGIVTGILATLISIAVTIALVVFGSTFMGSFETYEECLERGGTVEECEAELERDILDRFGQ